MTIFTAGSHCGGRGAGYHDHPAFSPFLLFPEGKQPPAFIRYLGTVLPSAVIGLLVVFCLKDAVFTSWHGLPELLGILVVALLHRWKKNILLSIAGGTIFYMVLVQMVF